MSESGRSGGKRNPVYITRRSRSTGGWAMCNVQLRCTVTSPVLGRQVHDRQGVVAPEERRPHEGPVAARHHPELTRGLVRARDRDADGEPAALVAVTPERAVLVPGDVGDALHDTDRLDERLEGVGVHLTPLVTVAGERAQTRQAAVGDEGGRRGGTWRRSPACAPAGRCRRRSGPTTTARLPGRRRARRGPCRCDTAAISSSVNTEPTCRYPA